jgi:L-lactate dehydrogenase complex protein LldF
VSTFLGIPNAPRGVGHLRGDEPFPVAARRALADTQLRRNLGKATATIRAKRAAVVAELPDWEELREAGRAIKAHTMRHLEHYLTKLESQVTARGGTVHWARDAIEANSIVTGLVRATGAAEVVKVKSIVTDEIGLNDALAQAGIHAYETDLAELIVQLGHDRPSHILVPAIHRNRAEIRDIFLREMRDVDPGLTDTPAALTEAARLHLRRAFLSARVGISGANFAVAETGTLCVLESEGNGRMCLTLPETLITVMGIEKVVPSWRDLDVFMQLLPRSSTGERMNPYTSMWTGVTPGDGPQEFHLVLLDNGRTAALADETGRQALHCIRCSACLNVCPVYERTGGHAYGSVYPGPIGAVLSPQLTGVEDNASLPYASSLCGACYDACPVKIDIPSLLVHLRARHVEEAERARRVASPEAITMAAASWVMASPARWGAAQSASRLGRVLGRRGRIRRLPWPLSAWTGARDLPAPPTQTFRQWWRAERAGPAAAGTGPNAGTGSRRHWAGRRVSGVPAPRTSRPPRHLARIRHDQAKRPRGRQGMLTARDEVLARIRLALRSPGPVSNAPPSTGPASTRPASTGPDTASPRDGDADGVPRSYRTQGELDTPLLLELLAERLRDYGCTVRRTVPGEVMGAVGEALGRRGARRIVVPPGLGLAGLPAGTEIVADDGLSPAALDAVDGVITGATVAIAETGTIVLDGSPDQGRRALSLVPDYHLCIVRAEQVVALVPEAMARLTPERPLTWISGPSATSDIELDRVQGVHGPRTLEVILVEPGPEPHLNS